MLVPPIDPFYRAVLTKGLPIARSCEFTASWWFSWIDPDKRRFRQYKGRLRFDEAVPALPLLFEAGPDGFSFHVRPLGIFGFGEEGGFELGELEELAVADEAGDAEVRQTGLAGAEELSGAALG